MRPDQLGDHATPSDPRIHPGGDRVAFVVSRMDLEADRYLRRIWLWDGSGARPLTAGPGDVRPRWSPDGAELLFLRTGTEEGAKAQVAVLPIAGGEAELVTDFELGVSEAEWSPDGSEIAVVAAEWIPELADLEEDERKRRSRRVTRVPYRGDNRGWVGDRRNHLWLVDPSGMAEPRCLTPGDDDEGGVAWSRDGSELAFVSRRHEDRELDPGGQIFTVAVAGGAAAARTPVGTWQLPTYAPDGTLHAIGDPDPWAWPGVPVLRRIDDELSDLTGFLDRSIMTFAPPMAPAGPQWLDDGSALCLLEDEGRIRVVHLTYGYAAVMVGGDRVVTGASPRQDGSAFAFTATTPTDPGELWWWEDGTERRLTSLNDAFREATVLVEPQSFTIEHDGVSVAGWIYLPEGDDGVPVLFNIHGGPATQYGYGFFDEFQVYAGAGYGVVAINPRGSSGYGREHVAAVVGRWDEEMPPDLADLLAAVDSAAAVEPRLDTARMGVMGGSYGGLMTLRVAAADSRYRSSVAERGLYSWPSFAGTSDIGMWFGKAYLGFHVHEDPIRTWMSSPLAHASKVETPMLVLHSETDWRTPIEQGEQLFAALKHAGVETEMVRFPAGEGHELSRSGSPQHRVERFEIILEWHDRHLR
ncbi:MAG TPA: S9 family peptidase [Acidimicrobiia bacterium]|jgi:dipeptidyl aminopeptidase/acylaminoacyl peptidase|nr:S9 family peptidase [Acidimicrobiia bacterium]